MPVPSAVVGLATEPLVHEVDARWTMAFAAGIGDLSPVYLDTTAPGGIVAHPLFPVCFEWPVVTAARRLVDERVLPRDEAARGVHATHQLAITRLVRPGDRLTTVATVVGVQRRSPGAYQTLQLTTTDEDGRTVCVTHMGSLFLGVEVDGEDRPAPASLPAPVPHPAPPATIAARDRRRSYPIAGNAALVYTECARIWNPIHTDPAVALAAGLPAPILHGTATLAIAVSDIVERGAGGDPTAVQGVACRFGAMVTMPSSIEVRLGEPAAPDTTPPRDGPPPVEGGAARTVVPFEVRNADDERAIRDGAITLRGSAVAV